MMRTGAALFTAGLLCLGTLPASAAVLVAQYGFDNTLASSVAGAPSLTAVDPSGTASFSTATTLNGISQTVYNFSGSASPVTDQGGLTFNNANGSGSYVGATSYSVELVFALNDRAGAWRRIMDSQNRTSDSGFYVDPSNNFDIYPTSGSTITFSSGTYYDVVLTNDNGIVTVYVDGQGEFTTLMTTAMNITSDNILGFFLDNTQGGGQGEWSSGSIALLSIYDGVLSSDDVATLYGENTNPTPAVPEPISIALLGTGLLAAFASRRIRR